MKIQKLINPFTTYFFVLLIFFLFFSGFSIGLIPSYLITERDIPLLGLINIFLFIISHLFGIWFGTKITLSTRRFFLRTLKLPDIYIYCLLVGFTMLAGWGLWKGALSHTSTSFWDYWVLSMGNRLRSELVWGKGYTIANSLSIVAFVLLQNKKRKNFLDKGLIFLNSIIIFLFAFSYSARLKLLILLVIPFVVYSRNKLTKNVSNVFFRPTVLLFSLVIFSIIIVGGGIRGLGVIAERYTNNPLSWTLSSFSDYFISTTLFSIHGLDNSPNEIPDLHTIREGLGPKDIHGYTNPGRYFAIYNKFGFWGIVAVFLFGIIIGFCWKQYLLGEPIGLLTYPLGYYFLIEGLRIEPFLVPDLLIPFVLLVFLAVIVNRKFLLSP